MTLTRAQLRDAILLARCTVAGVEIRAAERYVEPPSSTGPLPHPGGLDTTIRVALSRPYTAPSTSSVEAVVPVPAGLPAAVARGSMPAGSLEVALWAPGMQWEQRHILWRGRVRSLAVDGATVTVGAELGVDDEAQLCQDGVVDATTWPDADPRQSVGRAYPLVLGRPGRMETPAQAVPGSPCPVVDRAANLLPDRVLLAGHLVEATSVRHT